MKPKLKNGYYVLDKMRDSHLSLSTKIVTMHGQKVEIKVYRSEVPAEPALEPSEECNG